MENVEETNSGVKKKGDIEEVAEFAQEVEEGLKGQVDEQSIDEFDKWRPREEDVKEDIERKTVKSASLNQKKVEEKSEGVNDFSDAGKKTIDAGKKVTRPKEASKDLKKASKKFIRPIESGSWRKIRQFEESVYSNIMVKFNPYFFDAKEFSADLRVDKNGNYSMEVNVPDKSQRNDLKSCIEDREN